MIFYSEPSTNTRFALNPDHILEMHFTPGLEPLLWIKFTTIDYTSGTEEHQYHHEERTFRGPVASAIWALVSPWENKSYGLDGHGNADWAWEERVDRCHHTMVKSTEKRHIQWNNIMVITHGDYCTQCGDVRHREATEHTATEEEVKEYYS